MERLDADSPRDVLNLNTSISETSEPEETSYDELNEDSGRESQYQSSEGALSMWSSPEYRDGTFSMKGPKLKKILGRVRKRFGRFDGGGMHAQLAEDVAEVEKREKPLENRQNDSMSHQTKNNSNLVSEEVEMVSPRESPKKKNGFKHTFRSSLFNSLSSVIPITKSTETERDVQKEEDELPTAMEGEYSAEGREENNLAEELKAGSSPTHAFKWNLLPSWNLLTSVQAKVRERSYSFLPSALSDNQSEEESRHPSAQRRFPLQIRVYRLYYSSILSTQRVNGATTRERSSILKRQIEAMYLEGKLASSRYLVRIGYSMTMNRRSNTGFDTKDQDFEDSNSLEMESEQFPSEEGVYLTGGVHLSPGSDPRYDSKHETEACQESDHGPRRSSKSVHEAVPEVKPAPGHGTFSTSESFGIDLEHEPEKKGKDHKPRGRLFHSFRKDRFPTWTIRHRPRLSLGEKESRLEKPTSIFKKAITLFDQPRHRAASVKSHKEPVIEDSPSSDKGEKLTDANLQTENPVEQPSETKQEEEDTESTQCLGKIQSNLKEIHQSDKSISLTLRDIGADLNLKERMDKIILSQKDFLYQAKKLEILVDDLYQTAQSVDLLLNESLAKASYTIQHVREEKHRTQIGKKLLWNFLFLVVIFLATLLWVFSQLRKSMQKIYLRLQFRKRRPSSDLTSNEHSKEFGPPPI